MENLPDESFDQHTNGLAVKESVDGKSWSFLDLVYLF